MQKNRTDEIEKLDKMAKFIARMAKDIRDRMAEGDRRSLNEKHFVNACMKEIPESLSGLNLKLYTDNWFPLKKRRVFPLADASFSLVEEDGGGKIVSCAMTTVLPWAQQSVVFSRDKGCFTLVNTGWGGVLAKVEKVNRVYLKYPSIAALFSQKPFPEWAAMGRVVNEFNKSGIRTWNSCGSAYALTQWFSNFHYGAITPLNLCYLEPYPNSLKNALIAWAMDVLNRSIGTNFVITDMAGNPALKEGEFKKVPRDQDGKDIAGFIIATNKNSHKEVMSIFKEAVLNDSEFQTTSNESMRHLFKNLKLLKI